MNLVVINYQGMHSSVDPRDLKLGFPIGLAGVYLFGDHHVLMSSLVWVPLLEKKPASSFMHILFVNVLR